MTKQTAWIRYRRGSSSGVDYWAYAEVHRSEIPKGVKGGKYWEGWGKTQPAPDIVVRADHAYSWSEHNRGVEWEVIPCPPRQVLERLRNQELADLASIKASFEEHEKMLKTRKRWPPMPKQKKYKITDPDRDIPIMVNGVDYYD